MLAIGAQLSLVPERERGSLVDEVLRALDSLKAKSVKHIAMVSCPASVHKLTPAMHTTLPRARARQSRATTTPHPRSCPHLCARDLRRGDGSVIVAETVA